jgi:hypothetical protein
MVIPRGRNIFLIDYLGPHTSPHCCMCNMLRQICMQSNVRNTITMSLPMNIISRMISSLLNSDRAKWEWEVEILS